jgi:hypothetical protein
MDAQHVPAVSSGAGCHSPQSVALRLGDVGCRPLLRSLDRFDRMGVAVEIEVSEIGNGFRRAGRCEFT